MLDYEIHVKVVCGRLRNTCKGCVLDYEIHVKVVCASEMSAKELYAKQTDADNQFFGFKEVSR